MKILYVGGTPEFEPTLVREASQETWSESVRGRMASFEKFLKQYFTDVTVIHADDFRQVMSDDYDVTVMDGVPPVVVPGYKGNDTFFTSGYLTEDFSRPILTIGYISDQIGRRVGTKHDWYCLCLRSHAHTWRTDHPIFKGPFDVSMTVTERPTPEPLYTYPHHFNGTVPSQMSMWQVQTYEYSGQPNQRIGMVSRPGGYEDSPDAEYISGGHSDKSPDAVAIGRHGNFFHWGFAASPDNMAEEAKPVLANAIVYIAQFAGQTPIARKYNDRVVTRDQIWDTRQFISSQSYERAVEMENAMNALMAENKKKAEQKLSRGETLDQLESIAMSYVLGPEMTYEQHLRRTGGKLYDMFGTDIEAYYKYYDENYYYFCWDGDYELVVDEDAKSLGIPNNDIRILDRAIELLETGTDTDKARRILTRYTLVDFLTPQQWREWYLKYKDLLFFTESGGWVWLVDSREPGANDYRVQEERNATRNLPRGSTSDTDPVAIDAEVRVLQNGNRILNIHVTIHSGYHIYDQVASSDPYIPTAIEIRLPEGYIASGDVKRPAGSFHNLSGTTVYEDSIVFSQELEGEGPGQVKCIVTYQCCDNNICFPPQRIELVVEAP